MKKLNWFQLKILGFLGILGAVSNPKWRYFYLFFLLGLLELYIKGKRNPKVQHSENFYWTLTLSQFNFFVASKSVLQIFGQIIILARNFRGFPNRDNYQNYVKYRLPFNGSWTVVNGGSHQHNSHSWGILTQRYAYDFVITHNGLSYTDSGYNLANYYCFRQEVLAPADGVVVAAQNHIRDFMGVGKLKIDWKARDFRGNFIVIKHHEHEYSFIAHLVQNSLYVKVGDFVKQGQVIGLCGNSGHSTEPHIHFHLQDSPAFWIATGLPIRFENFLAQSKDNTQTVKHDDFVEKDEIVNNVN